MLTEPIPFVKRELKDLRKERSSIAKELASLEDKIVRGKNTVAALQEIADWMGLPSVLEKNDCSRLHKLIEAHKRGEITFVKDNSMYREGSELLWENMQAFVVQHNWADAFRNATDYSDGEVKLPYPKCVFEFRISGKTVLVTAIQNDDAAMPVVLLAFVQSDGLWFCGEESDRTKSHMQLAWHVIRAICIALDAEVATREVVRAPHKLNAQREKDGREPLRSYHVIQLNRRYRVGNLKAPIGGEYTRKRLHFRRGHWRHYVDSKTWIKWTLVGDPELGFIDKEYRL